MKVNKRVPSFQLRSGTEGRRMLGCELPALTDKSAPSTNRDSLVNIQTKGRCPLPVVVGLLWLSTNHSSWKLGFFHYMKSAQTWFLLFSGLDLFCQTSRASVPTVAWLKRQAVWLYSWWLGPIVAGNTSLHQSSEASSGWSVSILSIEEFCIKYQKSI